MHQIIRGLYLGSDDDIAKAKSKGMARLSCCKDGPDSHRSMVGYESLAAPQGKEYLFARRGDWMALNLIDVDDPTFIPDAVIDAGLKFIKEMMDSGKTVFVHCNAGHSRSPSMVLMFLRTIGEAVDSFVHAEKMFRTIYKDYDPGVGMRAHSRTRWRELKGFRYADSISDSA